MSPKRVTGYSLIERLFQGLENASPDVVSGALQLAGKTAGEDQIRGLVRAILGDNDTLILQHPEFDNTVNNVARLLMKTSNNFPHVETRRSDKKKPMPLWVRAIKAFEQQYHDEISNILAPLQAPPPIIPNTDGE